MRMIFSSSPLLLATTLSILAAPPLETPSQPLDFDSYRRNPIEAKRKATYAAQGRDLQSNLIAGEKGGKSNISKKAADLFPEMESIPLKTEPEPLPTPKELTDQVTARRVGEDTKGRIDLLARGKVAKELNLSSMSESEYEIYVSERKFSQIKSPDRPNLLNPMPTVTNVKTDGPAHAYSVTQAGVGNRAKPRSNQNPFEDAIKFLRLDQPITHGEDPLPLEKSNPPTPQPLPPTSSEQASPSAGTY